MARQPEQIRLDELVLALEGSITTAECVDDNGYCARAADCVTREVWTKVQHAVVDVLRSLTLKDLVDKTKCQHKALSYQI